MPSSRSSSSLRGPWRSRFPLDFSSRPPSSTCPSISSSPSAFHSTLGMEYTTSLRTTCQRRIVPLPTPSFTSSLPSPSSASSASLSAAMVSLSPSNPYGERRRRIRRIRRRSKPTTSFAISSNLPLPPSLSVPNPAVLHMGDMYTSNNTTLCEFTQHGLINAVLSFRKATGASQLPPHIHHHHTSTSTE